MNILVDGLNFELSSGSGIKTYTRSLIAALSENSSQVSVLSEKKFEKENFIEPVNQFLMASINQEAKQHKRINHLKKLLADVLALNNFKGNINLHDQKNVLSNLLFREWQKVDSIRVEPNLFFNAFIRARMNFGVTSIKPKYNEDALFLTSPIPIHLKGKLNIVTIHDLIPLTHPWLLEPNRWKDVSLIFGRTLKNNVQLADKIICISEFTRKVLLNYYPHIEEKVHVLYQPCKFSYTDSMGMDLGDFDSLALYGIKSKDYLLFCGAIEPKKNLVNLLKAYQLDKNLPKLVILGKYAWNCNEEKKLIHELGSRVIHLGYVPDSILETITLNCKTFIFPSVIEGFGLPPLEAMWHGTPCVLSDIDVFRELYGNSAYYCDPHNPVSILQSIHAAMCVKDVDRDRIKNYVRSVYTLKNFSEGLKNVLS